MYKRLSNTVIWLERNIELKSIRKGFIFLLPITIMGSVAELIKSIPIQTIQDLWKQFPFVLSLAEKIGSISFDYISIYLLFAISYNYASVLYRGKNSLKICSTVINFACYLASFGGVTKLMTGKEFGTSGVFTAIFCSILGTRIFFHIFFLMKKRNESSDHYIGVNDLLDPILPAFITVFIFVFINHVITKLFGVTNCNDLVLNGIVGIFHLLKVGFGTTLLFTFFENVLWIVGIHGSNILTPVGNLIFKQNTSVAMEFATVGFHNVFGALGGSGGTLCLILAILLFSKQKRNKKIGKTALCFSFFNINEPILFGLPIVLNPILAIPFFLVPIISLSVAALFIQLDVMHIVVKDVSWIVPPLFSGYIATGSFWGAFAQFISIVFGVLLYMPFLLLLEKVQQNVDKLEVTEFIERFIKDCRNDVKKNYISRTDNIGTTAKILVNALRKDIIDSKIPVHYQPQVDKNGNIVGAEALLRWKYDGQDIMPQLVISLAQQDDLFDALTYEILATACKDLQKLKEIVNDNMRVSVNISAYQLNDNNFVKKALEIIKENNAEGSIGLELTEEDQISNLENVESNIKRLCENHVAMAIDDFSMGKTSLKYLRQNNFAYVKIDGSLVKDISTNERCRDIIHSIIQLGQNLKFEIVAEYVENKEIRDILQTLDCNFYQGYLYSKAVDVTSFPARIKE